MEETPCSKLIQTLKANYTVEHLDEFFSATGEEEHPFMITIYTKDGTSYLASILMNFEQKTKEIFIGQVTRNLTNKLSKGLGKALLYLVVCKAIKMGYTIIFGTFSTLFPYYNALGFTHSPEEHDMYVTRPTANNFYPRIEELVKQMKPSSGGTRKKRKTRRGRK